MQALAGLFLFPTAIPISGLCHRPLSALPNEETMGKEDIIAAIQECNKKLGRPPTQPELRSHFPAISMGAIRKYMGSYAQALQESGFTGVGCGYEVTIDDLFRDWAQIVRKTGKIPTMTEYEHQSKYSVRPLMGRFRSWTQTPRGLHTYAEQAKLDVEYADVLNVIKAYYKEGTELPWTFATTKSRAALALPDRPVYGPPLTPAHLACGPTNEAGVVYLFGMLAGSLGFVVTRIQTEYPDCEALRQVGEERWQRVR